MPTDNPFYDGAGPNVDSIWARGLRNPFRASYDAPTGRLYIGDVGGNSGNSIEELNVGAAGANFGWPSSEGPCAAPCVSPIYSYNHNGRDASITGGFVYRGTQFPSHYQGSYFFADYGQNWIRRLTLDANGNVTGVFNFEPADGSVDGPYGDIVHLTQGPDGALYYVDLGFDDESGQFGVSKIRRIRYVQQNQAPVAVGSATPTSGPVPLAVSFSSEGSIDPEGQPLSYLWTFGDGGTSSEANPVHAYAQAGPYTARLEVSDGVNTTQAPPIAVNAGIAPTATIATPADGSPFRAGDVISFSGTATDPEDGSLPASAFTWSIDFLHEGHVHPGPRLSAVTEGSFTIPTSGHDFGGNTRYRILLTVTDSDGLQDTKSIVVLPDKVNLTFETNPAGLTLYVDGIAHATPFVYDTLIGFTHTIEARAQGRYAFDSWSDGGAQSHDITVPTAAQTYTATYNDTGPELPLGAIAEWSLDEGTGNQTADSSGNGHLGTLVGGPTWTTGPGERRSAVRRHERLHRHRPGDCVRLHGPVLGLVLDEAERLHECVGSDGDEGGLSVGRGPKLHRALCRVHDVQRIWRRTGPGRYRDRRRQPMASRRRRLHRHAEAALHRRRPERLGELLADATHQQLQPSPGNEPGIRTCLLRRGTGRGPGLRPRAYGRGGDVAVQPLGTRSLNPFAPLGFSL